MPMPVSRTSKRILATPFLRPTTRTPTLTWPRSVNLMAFERRLSRICRSRLGSPTSSLGSFEPAFQAMPMPRARARASVMRTAPAITSGKSNAICSNSTLPASTFAKSRMSVTISSSAAPDSRTVSAKLRCFLVIWVSSSRPVMPMTPLMGVRISWLMVAMNSDFARFAASAWLRASMSSRRSRCDSVASPMIPATKPPFLAAAPERARATVNSRRSPSGVAIRMVVAPAEPLGWRSMSAI